uniref:Uncharacterized protein n=1 Tax=Anguilla anguilla TaxID=7936 RepID=A0A0E9RTG3_ANGAN
MKILKLLWLTLILLTRAAMYCTHSLNQIIITLVAFANNVHSQMQTVHQ